uniref:Uncharacterized protein n=1 Tax=Arundo donax TaxID=35708 RepID=A0A0A9HR48_ARUDO
MFLLFRPGLFFSVSYVIFSFLVQTHMAYMAKEALCLIFFCVSWLS